jgi:hypothetical protein
MARAAVVEHLGDVCHIDGCVHVLPQSVVAFADFVLRNFVATSAYSFDHALHRQFNGHDDDVQVHQVAGANSISNEVDFTGMREHSLRNKRGALGNQVATAGLRNTRGFIGVLGLGLWPALGGYLVSVDEWQERGALQDIVNVTGLSRTVWSSKEVQQRHQAEAG